MSNGDGITDEDRGISQKDRGTGDNETGGVRDNEGESGDSLVALPAGIAKGGPEHQLKTAKREQLRFQSKLVKEQYPHLDLDILNLPPGVRMCCAIGYAGVFGGKLGTEILTLEQIKGHKYGAGGLFPSDAVGHIYTARGGFIDLGHVRDLADMTRYLSTYALVSQRKEYLPLTGQKVTLTPEGGKRKLVLNPIPNTDIDIASSIGARAAYELSIWHEIVTWFDEIRYSSFSPEDNFSNLLGCLIGASAFKTQGSFDKNVDRILKSYLKEFEAQPHLISEKAVEAVAGTWFDDTIDLTGDIFGGAGMYLLRRHMNTGPVVTPWLATDLDGRRFYGKSRTAGVVERRVEFSLGAPKPLPISLMVPSDANGKTLDAYYDLEIEVDTDKVPSRVLPNGTLIRSRDLGAVVENVRKEVRLQYVDGDKPM